MKRFTLFFKSLSIASCLLFIACNSEQQSTHDHSDDHGHEHEVEKSSSGEIVWDELRELDELSHRVEAQIESADESGILELSSKVVISIEKLLNAKIPKVKNQNKVDLLLADLKSIHDSLEQNKDATSSKALLKSLHPLVLDIMESAGLPHKHVEHDDHGHEHDDHGHGHDHDHGHEH